MIDASTSRKKRTPTIGLALGSGGARGLAHIGVLKTLEAHDIKVDYIAGTSIGALVGGLYAAGVSVRDLESLALSIDARKILSTLFEPSLKSGFIKGNKIEAFIRDYVGTKTIENCNLPFASVATNLQTGEVVVHDSGDLARAIRASISIPLIFKPVEVGGQLLVDGGLSAPVPVAAVRDMGADVVVAVNLDKKYHVEHKKKSGLYRIADDSLSILRHHLALSNIKHADVVIDIDTQGANWFQFTNGKDKIIAGEKATKNILPILRRVLRSKQTTHSAKKRRFGLFRLFR